MLGVVKAIKEDVKASLADIPGGLNRTEDDHGVAVVPSWWLHTDNLSQTPAFSPTVLVVLDLWHQSVGDIEDCLTALSWLWQWRAYAEGTFLGATYGRESIAILHEQPGIEHAVMNVSAVAWDQDLANR